MATNSNTQNFQPLTIAFDLRGTLISAKTVEDTIAMQLLLKRLKKAGHRIIVWSGDHESEVEEVIRNLHLNSYVDAYYNKLTAKEKPDVVFDDDPDFTGLASGDISKEDYELRKESILMDRINITKAIKEVEKRGDQWLERYEKVIIVATLAEKEFRDGMYIDKREIIKSIGSNYFLKDKKLDFQWLEPYNILAKKDKRTNSFGDRDSNPDSRLQRAVSCR